MVSAAFQQVDFRYGKQQVFRSLDLRLQSGEDGTLIGLVGCNASGKTTLLRLIAGLERAERGRVLVTPSNEFVEYLPHDPVLFEHLNVWDNVCLYSRFKKMSARFSMEAARSAILDLGLVGQEQRDVRDLSAGQRQRVCIARALSVSSKLVLLDEPCTNLDPQMRSELMGGVAKLSKKAGAMVVVASHEPWEIVGVADSLVALVQDGTPPRSSMIHAERVDVKTEWPVLPSREVAELFRTPSSIEYRVSVHAGEVSAAATSMPRVPLGKGIEDGIYQAFAELRPGQARLVLFPDLHSRRAPR